VIDVVEQECGVRVDCLNVDGKLSRSSSPLQCLCIYQAV